MKKRRPAGKGQSGRPHRLPRRRLRFGDGAYLLGQVLQNGGQAAPALDLYIESQRLFEALGERGERMASVTLTEQADCLTALGRLDEAAAKYAEASNGVKNWKISGKWR